MLRKMKNSVLSMLVGGSLFCVSLGTGGCIGGIIDGLVEDFANESGYCDNSNQWDDQEGEDSYFEDGLDDYFEDGDWGLGF